jgi:hypothetical protein
LDKIREKVLFKLIRVKKVVKNKKAIKNAKLQKIKKLKFSNKQI